MVINFLNLWTSDSDGNYTGWKNTKYDDYIKTAKTSLDPKTRMTALHNAEKIIMEELPVCPLYYGTSSILKNPKISGVFISPDDYLYLQYARFK